MHVPFVDLNTQYKSIKEDVDQAIASVIKGSSYVGGEAIESFENAFAKYIGSNHCIGVANGTDAIEIALRSLGIGKGDEVIVPSLSWISTASAVNSVGAEPVFVDILEGEWTINPALIDQAISRKTKAIIPVHLYGLPARMNEIMLIAQSHELKVIEDCAQAHGAEIAGKKVGTYSDLATFSFYPTKNLGAYGDAGAILTDDDSLASICRKISNLGQEEKNKHELLGRNSRLDTIQAAILKAKLPHLDKWIESRIQIAGWYDQNLSEVGKLIIPSAFKHVFHLYTVQHPNRIELISTLNETGIGFQIHYPKPLPFLDCYSYQNHKEGDFPIAGKLCEETISLPMYAELSREQVQHVCSVVNAVKPS